MADHENMNVLHESHELFKREHDEQLVQWMNRYASEKNDHFLLASKYILIPENVFKFKCGSVCSMSNVLEKYQSLRIRT